MNTKKRRYEQRKRAEHQDATRQRIVEAAVLLHEQLGPAQTSVSSIAEQAGVSRPTVYRHFPDERAIFSACTGHYLAQHPPPDVSQWGRIEEPTERFRTGLLETYRWYEETAEMLAKTYRDLPEVPVLGEVLQPMMSAFERGADVLAQGWVADDHHVVRAAIGHALAFQTWRSLVQEQQLESATVVELMTALVETAARARTLAAA